MKKLKRKVDNKMGSTMGMYDENTHTIKINKKESKKENKRRGKGHRNQVLDSIVHEEMHAKHPKMHEKTVYKKTPKAIKKMGKLTKHKLYGYYAG